MPIARDLSDLPAAAPTDGHRPVKNMRALSSLMRVWEDQYEEAGSKHREMAIPDAGPFRASFAGNRCDRQMHYALEGTPKTEPADVSGYWVFALGTFVHDTLQAAALEAWPGAVNEVPVDLRPLGIPGSGTADTVVYTVDPEPDDALEMPTDERRALFNVEIKSVGGYGFKSAAVDFNGPPEGPHYSAVVQGALANRALGAEKMIVVNAAKENVSKSLAKSKKMTPLETFIAGWEYSAAECDVIVRKEAARLERVLMYAGTGILPARELHDPDYPAGAVVTDPTKGLWIVNDPADGRITAQGSTWLCSYCDWFSQCQADGAGGGGDGGI